MTATTTPTPEARLDAAELLVQQTGEAFTNAKSALRALKAELKPARQAGQERQADSPHRRRGEEQSGS
jgi:hypothetical protein